MPSSKGGTSSTMKGYIPLRINLPSNLGTSYIFIKEHGSRGGDSSNNKSSTLFVTNAPLVPGILSRLFLLSLFERFGTVEKVTVLHNLRNNEVAPDDDKYCFQKEHDTFGFGRNVNDEGKFAHVTFVSSKEMKKALTAIKMTGGPSKGALFYKSVEFNEAEIDQLRDETDRVHTDSSHNTMTDDTDGMESKTMTHKKSAAGKHQNVLNLYQRAHAQIRPRSQLLHECNTIIQQFEAKEEASRRQQKRNTEQPDDDGFITVSHATTTVGTKRELTEEIGGFGSTMDDKVGSKRRRTKKEGLGAQELKDFYRFQMRESKKKNLQELRLRFEEDLANVKKMKEEKLYVPFKK